MAGFLNRRVGVALCILSAYGVILIVVTNSNINPLPYFKTAAINASNAWYATRVSSEQTSSNVTISMSNKTHLDTKLSSTTTRPPPTAPIVDGVRPIITMFTTFKDSSTKNYIYQNTIRNWAMLRPHVVTIMYTVEGEINLAKYGAEYGWINENVPVKAKNGIPVLRHMYLRAMELVDTPFYTYANGDILFDMGLIDTLRTLNASYDKLDRGSMIVGRRTNVQFKANQEVKSLAEIGELAKKGKLFGTNAQDYFISTKKGYPWNNIPDFVVGRIGYDNWLVVTAITRSLYVVDVSETVLAVHQTGTDGNFAGHSKKKGGDTYINYGLAGKKFDYQLGHVTCAQFTTKREKGQVNLVERTKNPCIKVYKKYKKNPYIHLHR